MSGIEPDRAQVLAGTPVSPRDGVGYRIVEGEHHDRVYMLDRDPDALSHDESLRLFALQQVTSLKAVLMLRGDGQNESEMDVILAMAARIESYIRDGAEATA